MTCDHCVQTITKAVGDVPGVQSVEVDLESKEVAVAIEDDRVNRKAVSAKIVEVGFEVVEEKG